MANITNNNFNKIDLKVSKSDYWDLILSKESDPELILDGSSEYTDTLISKIDINEPSCVSGNSLFSLNEYVWKDAVNNGVALKNTGFNSIDNGELLFDINNITSDNFINIVTGKTLNLTENDLRLRLNAISGNTHDYEYPVSYMQDAGGSYIRLEGGFYQGFFKSGNDYSVLPDFIKDEISFDFVIKPDLSSEPKPNTLNKKYPNNRGIFFYIGTRSENKFWYDYFKNDNTGFTFSKLNTISPYTGDTISTNDGFTNYDQNIFDITTDNKYLLINRTESGYLASTIDNNAEYHITGKTYENINYYLYNNRTATGITASNKDSLSGITNTPYDLINDITRNALAFIIRNDGSIGYRILNSSCTGESNYTIDEEFSQSGVTSDNSYTVITARLLMNEFSDCQTSNRTFKIMFYVNGMLVFISKELPELLLRKLSDIDEKQETIPYNISIGGGTQGLCDMIGFNNNYSNQYLLPVEENFAGSMIGSIYKFRVYYGKMDFSKIRNNAIYESGYTFNPGYILPSISFKIDGEKYKRESGDLDVVLNADIKLNDVYNPLVGYKLYYMVNSNTRTQINGFFNINPSGGTVNYPHRVPDVSVDILKYIIEVFDTSNTQQGIEKIQTINFDNMIFYGTASIQPTGSTEIRSLSNKIFENETNTFILNTNPANEAYRIFVIAMPKTSTLFKVEDNIMGSALCLDITSLFIEHNFDVADAGGTLIPYRIYIMQNAIPYSSNHGFIVTVNTNTTQTIYEIPLFEFFIGSQDTTVEVGTTVSGDVTFNFNIVNMSNVNQNTLSILDVTNNNSILVSDKPVLSPINVPVGNIKNIVNGTTNSWKGRAENSNGTLFSSSLYTITWKLKTFYGPVIEFPSTSNDVRSLDYSIWDNQDTFDIIIGGTTLKYVIAIGSDRNIKSIITENDEDIADLFVLRNTTVPVKLADGTTDQSYKIYEFEIIIPMDDYLLATVTLE